jgi:hypothetical protein
LRYWYGRRLADGFEIEGNVQVKRGLDSGMVSEILDAPEHDFIPVTQPHPGT